MEKFLETYDSSMAMAQSGFVRARLESGVRDEKGRFRIAQGTSSLHVPDPAKKGLTIAELQAQVDAERKVKEEARMAKKRKADSTGASTAPKERAGKGADASHGGEEWQSTWVVPGIVVKIMSKENKDIYKLKGAVRVIAREGDKGDVVATVELDDGSEHKVHSRDLETVIPAVGGTVRVVSGRYRGEAGELLALETELFQGRIRLLGGANDGKEVMLDYEHFSKQDRRSGGGGQKSK